MTEEEKIKYLKYRHFNLVNKDFVDIDEDYKLRVKDHIDSSGAFFGKPVDKLNLTPDEIDEAFFYLDSGGCDLSIEIYQEVYESFEDYEKREKVNAKQAERKALAKQNKEKKKREAEYKEYLRLKSQFE